MIKQVCDVCARLWPEGDMVLVQTERKTLLLVCSVCIERSEDDEFAEGVA
jgi:hypothetical protein